ncbi:hypothetical protein V1264_001652 [Littorina saxatilis]|uniref:Uncharacterized protein n=1 Tax=Littorina saxatilis TaxID=31220 RepID=A0AAN9GR48_9CAEN
MLLSYVMATSLYHSLMEDLRSREAGKSKVPPGGGINPLTVDVNFVPLDLLDIDNTKQVISISSSLTLSWTDTSLTWDSSPTGSYANLHAVEVNSDDVWTPRVLIMNGASNDRMVDMGPRATLLSNGTVSLAASPLIQFTCSMDLEVYPFDVQDCKVLLVPISPVPILFRPDRNPVESRESFLGTFNGEGTIESVEALHKETSLPGMPLEYRLRLKRKMVFYVTSFIVPIVLTSYMNTLVFVIPAESGERVSCLVSIFVSNAVFVSFCTDQMPQGLDSVPLVTYLQLGTMVQSAVYILLVSYVLCRFYRQDDGVTDDVTKEAPDAQNAVPHLTEDFRSSKSGDAVKRRKKRVEIDFFLTALVLNTVFVVWFLSGMMK